ncbi:MAG: Gfo/Idh/MocA family oxidoreductase [Myxococcaceae bacterium]|nr:Gfo/Idh/MocA family oxidoreductase [Myxococcaceae bacterium]
MRRPSFRPRIGFLGVGWIGRHRMEAVARCPEVEVAAVCDPAAEAAQAAARLAEGCQVVGSYEALLDHGLDAVVIATPSALHAPQAIAALERGLAVFCQKPLGRNAAEVRQVVDAARCADRFLAVDLSYRFTAAMQAIRAEIDRGALGRVFAVDLTFHNAYGPDKPWFYDRAQSGGGCVVDLGIHLVDLALWALGFPKIDGVTSQLYAGGERLGPSPAVVEDYAVAQLQLATGTVVRLACSWKVSAGCDAVIEATFFGTRGGAALRNVNGSFYDFVAERLEGTRRVRLVSPPDAWGGRAAVDWAHRLAAGQRFDPEAERLVELAFALDRIAAGG